MIKMSINTGIQAVTAHHLGDNVVELKIPPHRPALSRKIMRAEVTRLFRAANGARPENYDSDIGMRMALAA